MSNISSDDQYGGNVIRRMIDCFCYFMQRPLDYEAIIGNDSEFAKSEALNEIMWVVNEQGDIYFPTYTDDYLYQM